MTGKRMATASMGGTTSVNRGVATRPRPMKPLFERPRQVTAAPAVIQKRGLVGTETASSIHRASFRFSCSADLSARRLLEWIVVAGLLSCPCGYRTWHPQLPYLL